MPRTLLPVLALACAATAQVVQLAPIADATADELQGSVNFGADPQIRLGSQFVTSLAQDWLSGAQPNQGVVLRHPTEANFDVATGVGPSRENASLQLRPYLELDFGSTFGAGCATAGGVPVLRYAGGVPVPGASFILRTTGMLAGALPALVLGTSNTQWSGNPLPLSLAPFGFPTCQLLVADEAQQSFPPLAGTTLAVTLPVPNNALLVGLSVFGQTAAVAPSGALQLSNGFGLAIR